MSKVLCSIFFYIFHHCMLLSCHLWFHHCMLLSCHLWFHHCMLLSCHLWFHHCMLLSCHLCFQSESTLYSCLNVKELLAQNRRDIWNLSDNNGIWTQKHLVPKRTPNHLARRAITLSVLLRISLLSLKTLTSKSYSAKFLLKEGGIFKIVVTNRYRYKNVQ